MSETISGKIIDAGPEGLTIRAPYSDWQRFVLRRYEDVQVLLCDGRQLTPKQSRAIHAMVHDIARWQSGFAYRDRVFHETLCALQLQYIIDTTDSEEVRYSLTQRFCDLMDIPLFSLSPKNENCADMTTAREFLGWLIDLCVAYDIPTSGPLSRTCGGRFPLPVRLPCAPQVRRLRIGGRPRGPAPCNARGDGAKPETHRTYRHAGRKSVPDAPSGGGPDRPGCL